jgi:hypothetical protein
MVLTVCPVEPLLSEVLAHLPIYLRKAVAGALTLMVQTSRAVDQAQVDRVLPVMQLRFPFMIQRWAAFRTTIAMQLYISAGFYLARVDQAVATRLLKMDKVVITQVAVELLRHPDLQVAQVVQVFTLVARLVRAETAPWAAVAVAILALAVQVFILAD